MPCRWRLVAFSRKQDVHPSRLFTWMIKCSSAQGGLLLVVAGALRSELAAFAKHARAWVRQGVLRRSTVSVCVTSADEPYGWLMAWMTSHPRFKDGRHCTLHSYLPGSTHNYIWEYPGVTVPPVFPGREGPAGLDKGVRSCSA